MEFRPLGDRVVLKPMPREEMTTSGLVIPDTAREKPQTGKVIAVGAGRLLENGERVTPEVSLEQTVLYGKYSGTEVKLEGDDYLLLRENEILAVVKPA